MWFVGQRVSENGNRARQTEKGGTSVDIDSDLGNKINEQSQRMFVHNTPFVRDKLWSTKPQQVNAIISNCFGEKYFLN